MPCAPATCPSTGVERRRRAWRAGVVLGVVLAARDAAAAPPTEAGAVYDQAAAAYDRGDYVSAASLYAQADDLAPNPLVLKYALAAASRVDDPVLGMTLVLRAEARAVDGSLADLAKMLRPRWESKVGTVRLVCARSRTGCLARLDGRFLREGESVAAAPGPIELAFGEGDNARTVRAEVRAASLIEVVEPPALAPAPARPARELRPSAPAPAPPPSRPRGGLPPWVFWGGGALTVVAGGAAIGSGLDTRTRHDAYLREPTAADQDAGRAAQVRTNVLVGVAVGIGVATAVIGAFFTRWSKPRPAAAAFLTATLP